MKIISTSFGYNMTLNVFAKVLSETPKSMLVQEIGMKSENDNGGGSGRAYPNRAVAKGNPFRVFKREYNGKRFYKGKLPGYSSVDYWTDYEGGGNYHNTWD